MADSSTIAREGDQPCISTRDQFPERRGDWMQTFSGRRFWPLHPRAEDVCVEDIAHALSLQCRYGGHCLWFYSVAEHSVLLAKWVLDHGAGSIVERRILALWLLLHDGGESYVSDMVRPLKRHMPEFRNVEDGVTWAIYERFGLDPAMEPREVKQLDNRILMDERAQVMCPTGDDWHFGGETEPLGVKLQFWSPERAEQEFLAMFGHLAAPSDMAAPSALTTSEA